MCKHLTKCATMCKYVCLITLLQAYTLYAILSFARRYWRKAIVRHTKAEARSYLQILLFCEFIISHGDSVFACIQVAQKLIGVMRKNERKARPKKKILVPCIHKSDTPEEDDDLEVVYIYHPAGTQIELVLEFAHTLREYT